MLVELLDEDYTVNRTLILSALEGIESVFDLQVGSLNLLNAERTADEQSPTPRNDFCRMFVRESILDPLSNSILSIMRDSTLSAEDDSCSRAVNLLLLFSQVSQADNRVREAFVNRSIMIRESPKWTGALSKVWGLIIVQDFWRSVQAFRRISYWSPSKLSSTSPLHLSSSRHYRTRWL